MKLKKDNFTWLSVLTLIIFTAPIILGYLWLFISTFSERTYGLKPVDINGDFGPLKKSCKETVTESNGYLYPLLSIGLIACVIIGIGLFLVMRK